MDQDIIVAEFSVVSTREVAGAGPTTLHMVAYNDGSVIFEWSDEQRKLGTVEFCINAFFGLLTGIPKIFNQLGQPLFFGSCDMPTILAIFHDETFPEIGVGILNEGEKSPVSIAAIDRGALLTMLDQIGNVLATLKDVYGCGDGDEDEYADDAEPIEIDTTDPFAQLDMNTRH